MMARIHAIALLGLVTAGSPSRLVCKVRKPAVPGHGRWSEIFSMPSNCWNRNHDPLFVNAERPPSFASTARSTPRSIELGGPA